MIGRGGRRRVGNFNVGLIIRASIIQIIAIAIVRAIIISRSSIAIYKCLWLEKIYRIHRIGQYFNIINFRNSRLYIYIFTKIYT